MPLTKDEARELGRLLRVVVEDARQGIPYPIPELIYESLHELVPYPAIDMVLLDDQDRVLWVWRDDKYFCGFELVGGYGHWQESFPEWCERLARRDVGARVEFIGFTQNHKWKNCKHGGQHPHGAPISLVAVCRLAGPVTRDDVHVEFLDIDTLPDVAVPNHPRFVEVAREALETGKMIPGTCD